MAEERKYFGTDGIRSRVGELPINAEFVLKLGWAVGKVLGEGSGGRVLIGKDTRISGYMLESALEAGLSAAGMNIQLLGPMPTPAIAYLTRTFRAQAGVVISASHNLYHDNGIKFFAADGRKLADDLELDIERQLALPMTTVDSASLGKAMRIDDAAGRYIEYCKSTCPAHFDLRGLKLVVDCANGATYHVAPNVFRELGAEVIELSVEPDGVNINERCGATSPALLQKIVLAEQADLGIALDGDGDRVIMVDHKGEIVEGDEILFIIAQHLKQKTGFKGGVVGTLMSNLGLELSLREMDIDFRRTKVGDRYVIAEMDKCGWLLGGENSGHIICSYYSTTGDGIVAALQVLYAMQQTEQNLYELKRNMKKFPQVMHNIRLSKRVDLSSDKRVQDVVAYASEALKEKGRVLLRLSGTEPVIRVMVEGEDSVLVHSLALEISNVVREVAS